MLRTLRRISPLLVALFIGGVTASTTVLMAGSLAGCTDENAPETHVERLKDPLKRTAAVKRLILFYEDAMTNDKKDRKGKNVAPLLEKILMPLIDVAMKGDLDQKTQGQVLSFLADTQDKRAGKALAKAVSEYKPDDKRGEKFDADMANVVRGLGALGVPEANAPLLKLFVELRASYPKARYKGFYRILRDTMLKIADPSWESQLIKLLARPIKTLKKKQIKAITNEVFWQTVAAEILGKLKSRDAVVPLIKVVLSPFKVNLHTTSIVALIKIGKPAIKEGVKLLNGDAPKLIKYAEDEYLRRVKDNDGKVNKKVQATAKSSYKGAATIIVSNIGRGECIEPMLKAAAKGDAVTKAVIGRELSKLPADPGVTKAFKGIWEKMSLTQSMPPAGYAKEALSSAVGTFFDQKLAVWLAEKALELKGDEGDVAPVQQVALEVLMKTAGKADWPLIEKLAAIKVTRPTKTTVGKAFEKELKKAKALVDKCDEKGLDCYAKVMASSEAQKGQGFEGIKAAYMVATKGEAARAKLVAALPRLSNAAVRFVAVSAIDRLSPKGSKKTADALQVLVDKAYASKDERRIKQFKSLNPFIYRLRARAQ